MSPIPHNWKCRCIECRVWKARYFDQHRRGVNLFVPADKARKYLKTFQDATDAARVLKVHQTTVSRILNRKVKKIRKSTEQRILKVA